LHRPRYGLSLLIDNSLVGTFQERLECSRLVILSGSQAEVQRMTVLVAKQMDFRGKSAARTP
jgi:hypothetical protein